MQRSTSRLRPPDGAELLKARKVGASVNCWCFGGARAWELAKHRGPGRLVLPGGEPPESFNWSCIAGLDVVVRWPDATLAEVDDFGRLLVRSGARCVWILEDLMLDRKSGRYLVTRLARRFVPARGAA